MSKSRRSSNASEPFLCDWQPSRWLGAGLWALALLAPFSLLASDLAAILAWPLAIIAAVAGTRSAWRYQRQPGLRLRIPAGRGQPSCNDAPIADLSVSWRGPLAFLCWRDKVGCRCRASLWPDTLDAGMRRELRIAMLRREAASDGASVAG